MIRINRVDYLYNIQWEDKHPIIVDNNKSRIDTLSPVGESAELAITSYLVCIVYYGMLEH